MSPRISIVVLAHGAGPLLADCLASIEAQPYEDVEVLVVDDGTAIPLPERDGLRLIQAGQAVRGAARNLGAAQASGDLLMFLDGGDVLAPGALPMLADALASGADIAVGRLGEFTEACVKPSRRAAVARTTPRTRVDFADRHVANLLMRRSFWAAQGLAFPELSRCEELAVAIGAQAMALRAGTGRSVPARIQLVARQVVWRRAARPVPSTEPQDVTDGFAAVRVTMHRMDGLTGGRWSTKQRRRFLEMMLNRDLRVFLDALPDASDAQRAHIVEQAARFAASVEGRVFAALPALTRLKWHLAQRRLTTELVKVVRYERAKNRPLIVRDPIRRYVVYPYWKDDKVRVPKRVYLAGKEVRLRSRLHEVRWEHGKLVVSGEAFIRSVSSRRRWTAIKGVVLRSRTERPDGRKDNRRIRLLARQTRKPGKSSGPWTGFTFTLDPRKLRGRGGWRDGSFDIHAAVFNTGLYRRGLLAGGRTGSAANPPYHYVEPGVRIVPEIVRGKFKLRVETVRALVTALSWSDDALMVTGVVRDGVPAALRLSCSGEIVTVPVRPGGPDVPAWSMLGSGSGEPCGFTAAIGLPELTTGAEQPDGDAPGRRPGTAAPTDDTVRWRLAVVVGDTVHGEEIPLVMAEGIADVERHIGGREAAAQRRADGYLRLAVRTARLVVTGCSLRPDGTLCITGRHPVARQGEIVLRSRVHHREHAFGLVQTADGLTAQIPLAAVATLAGVLPLRRGRWDLLFREGPRDQAMAVSLSPKARAALPISTEVALREYSLENLDGRPVVQVSNDLRPEERKAGTKMHVDAWRRVAKTGLRDTVLFSCFSGRQYADSPRAIHEELARRGHGLEHLWGVRDGQVELPGTAQPVRLKGQEWYEALASSRYIVANHRLGDWFSRHPDQIVLQTWHGTPLKKLGRDVKEVHFAYAPGMKKALQSNLSAPPLPEWTHLISPNPFSTDILRRAFRFKGEMLETGYPRNDLLYSPDADMIATSARNRIGIPAGKRVVLYAPTWRDDQFYRSGRYKLDWRIDLDRFRAVLGDDHVLMVRLHPNVVDAPPEDDLVYDVSAYPDITELYLASDIMVSDYSSVMFDFANTRKPQLFFTYDLAHYRDTLRGFYFDFEAEAPGPLLESSDELIEALRSIDEVSRSYKSAYDAFHERFCSLEDGKAAARVIDAVFDV